MAKSFSSGALTRRLSKGAPTQTGTPVGPRGGQKQLAPQNSRSAGSMFKKNPKAGRLTKGLQNLPKPR